MAAGGFSDLAVHHHPAVQVTVGGQGPLTLSRGGDAHEACRLVVVGSGTRHAVRSDARSAALTLYFGLQTPQGIALNRLTRNRGQHESIWIVDDGPFTRSYDRRLKSCRAECPATSMWLRSRMPWRYRRIPRAAVHLNFVGLGGRFAESPARPPGHYDSASGSPQWRAGELVGVGDIP